MLKFECEICLEEYDLSNRRPVVGNCGHTFCYMCSTLFVKSQCPTCRKELAFHNAPTNFELLSRIHEQDTLQRQNSRSSPNHENSASTSRANQPVSHFTAVAVDGYFNSGYYNDDFRAQTVQPVREVHIAPEVQNNEDTAYILPFLHKHKKEIAFILLLVAYGGFKLALDGYFFGVILFCFSLVACVSICCVDFTE